LDRHGRAEGAFHFPISFPSKELNMLNRIRKFVKSEDGPTAVEYAVMLALIIVVCLVAITALGTNANATFTTVSNKIAGS
jgi:pilus assembly protein Flp/PilA